MAGEFSEEAAWTAAQRFETWAGEVRVNLVRLAAIAALYGHHLFNRFVLKLEIPRPYHLAVTGIAAAWTLGALALHAALGRRWNPPWLRFSAVAFDAIMIASVLLVSDGPRGPFFMLLFLLIATAGLRLDLRLVWTAATLAILVYALACGHDRWIRKLPDPVRVPRSHQVIVMIGLACGGLLSGQAVRQARRFARDAADRMKPDGAA
jgi:hypothetical protein